MSRIRSLTSSFASAVTPNSKKLEHKTEDQDQIMPTQEQQTKHFPDVEVKVRPHSSPPITTARDKKKASSEGDLFAPKRATKIFDRIMIGPSPRFSIICSQMLPFAIEAYSIKEAEEIALFSSYFRIEGCFMSILGTTEKVKRPTASEGKLEDLVEWCSFFPGTNLVRNMLLGYRKLFQPSELLAALRKQRKKYKIHDLLDDNVEERFYAFIIQWVLLWRDDFRCPQTRKKLLQFSSLCFKSYRNALPYLENLLEASPIECAPGYLSISLSVNSNFRVKRRPSFSRSRTKRNIGFYHILDYDAEEIAKQLTMLEAVMISEVSVLSFIGKDWIEHSKRDNSPLAALSTHFNRVSLWVASAIVHCSQRKRIRMYKKFIRVAKKLYEFRNYSSACQVITGLENAAVTRLKCREEIADNLIGVVDEIQQSLSPLENYASYRNLKLSNPHIPLLPVCLRDLTYLYETSPDYIDKDEKVINLLKIHQITNTIYDMNLLSCAKYSFTIEEDCKEVILFTLAMAKNSEEIYENCLVKHPANQLLRPTVCAK